MTYPPYTWPENKLFQVKYTSGCFCGHVQYEIAVDKPLDAKFCHCKTCQRLHGAPFQWVGVDGLAPAAIIEKADMRFTSGTDELVFWNAEANRLEHELPCKVSCGHCRTPIMDEGGSMLLIFPTLVAFPSKEAEDQFGATCHIFYGSRVVDVKDGLPKWKGHKDRSERIPDW